MNKYSLNKIHNLKPKTPHAFVHSNRTNVHVQFLLHGVFIQRYQLLNGVFYPGSTKNVRNQSNHNNVLYVVFYHLFDDISDFSKE